jgi:hypothetical protein
MDEGPSTVIAFKQRRRQTWKATRYWWLLLAFGLIGFWVPFHSERAHVHKMGTYQELSSADMTQNEFTLNLVSLCAIFAAGIGILVGIRRHYRCPQCDQIPMGSSTALGPSSFGVRWGVDIFPTVCPTCGAKLS